MWYIVGMIKNMTAQEPYATAWGRNYSPEELKTMSLCQLKLAVFKVRTYNVYLRIILRWYRIKIRFYRGLSEFITGIGMPFS